MIADLPERERTWLARFFSAPNELSWADIEAGTAPQHMLDAVLPWLSRLSDPQSDAPIVLPFYRNGTATGWYATAATHEGGQRLTGALRAWLGGSYLSHLQPAAATNPSAAAMKDRYGRAVLAFRGPDTPKISQRLALLAALDAQRPDLGRKEPRPVGRVRSDLEGAILAKDESTAINLIEELRNSGRLNEENLSYLDVRLKGGLGQWDRIARDYWAIKNLADLPLPPQTLSDLIEALYRVYVDDADVPGNLEQVRAIFEERLAKPFPKLFGTRHGVRTPRVVKAFILYEAIQKKPSPAIIRSLVELLPSEASNWAAAFPFESPPPELSPETVAPTPPPPAADDAEAAFDDGQYDRAFEFYLSKPLERRSLNRLLACVRIINTADARQRLLSAFDASTEVRGALPEELVARVDDLREAVFLEAPTLNEPPGWMRWARSLATGEKLDEVEKDILENRSTWNIADLRRNAGACAEFADIIGNLTGHAAVVARRALPLIVSAFLPEDEPAPPATKAVASLVVILFAVDEAIGRAELDLLSTALVALLDLGMSTADYLITISDIEAIQARVASYANLPWSLDIAETLAVSPCPSPEATEARLRFFVNLLGQSRSFAHRLGLHDFLPIKYLAQDYGIDPAVIADLEPASGPENSRQQGIDLAGKTVGIYTLTETAGARAKAVLQALYPGCAFEINSDTVCTSGLKNLASTADIFVFAWRSSSHQAFFCIKGALSGRDPIYAAGKGAASIVNAVLTAAR